MRALAIAGALIGCGGKGVEIDVHAPAGSVDHVELFVAYNACANPPCPDGIAWLSQMTEAPAGTIYELAGDALYSAPYDGGVARFRLDAEPGKTHVGGLAAIAFASPAPGTDMAAALVITNRDIPTDHEEVWQLSLNRVDEVGSSPDDPLPTNAIDRQAHVWRRPAKNGVDPARVAACAMIQHWDGTTWNRSYFVPPGDTDCDGEAIECDPFWLDFGSGQSSTLCLTKVGPLDPGICTIGASLCADGVSATTDCTQQAIPEICVPSAACACTAPITEGCIAKLIGHAVLDPTHSPIPLVDCTFVTDLVNAGGPCTVNNENHLAIALPTKSGHCTAVALRPLALPLMAPAPTITVAGMTFTANVTDPATCALDIAWNDGPAGAGAVDLLLDVSSDAGKAVMPLRIEFDRASACPAPVGIDHCQLLGSPSEPMYQCL